MVLSLDNLTFQYNKVSNPINIALSFILSADDPVNLAGIHTKWTSESLVPITIME